jgi:hypothetical protein
LLSWTIYNVIDDQCSRFIFSQFIPACKLARI